MARTDKKAANQTSKTSNRVKIRNIIQIIIQFSEEKK